MRFYLSNKLKDGDQSIFLSVSLGAEKIISATGKDYIKSKRFRYYTGIRIHPKYWDNKNQRARLTFTKSKEVNDYLQELKDRIFELKLTARKNNEEFSVSSFRSIFKGSEAVEKITLLECFEKYLDNHRTILSEGTLKIFRTLKDNLSAFQEELNYRIDFETIDNIFLNEFKTWLYEVQDNSDNTVSKNIEKLKTFLNWATENKFNSQTTYKTFKANRRDKIIVFLSEQELKKVQNLDLTANKSLERVRDVFCFGCYTGLRYSDLFNLKPENITLNRSRRGKKEYHLSIFMKKVKKSLDFSLPTYAIGIIAKYKDVFQDKALPAISNQMYNQYIKDVCEAAKLNTPFVKTRFKGSMREDENFKKYEVVSAHSSRHTFAILSLQRGMKVEVLKELMGHHDIEQTMVYVKITDEFKSNAMKTIWN